MVEQRTENPCVASSILALGTYRGVAQLVERVVWDHEAEGSSPFAPTNSLLQGVFCLWYDMDIIF